MTDESKSRLACARLFDRYKFHDDHWPAFSVAWSAAIDWAVNDAEQAHELYRQEIAEMVHRHGTVVTCTFCSRPVYVFQPQIPTSPRYNNDGVMHSHTCPHQTVEHGSEGGR